MVGGYQYIYRSINQSLNRSINSNRSQPNLQSFHSYITRLNNLIRSHFGSRLEEKLHVFACGGGVPLRASIHEAQIIRVCGRREANGFGA